MLLAAGIVKGLKVMRVDDSLAFVRPKAYPNSQRNTVRGVCSRRSLDVDSPQAVRDQGWQTSPPQVCRPWSRPLAGSDDPQPSRPRVSLCGVLPANLPPLVSPAAGRPQETPGRKGRPRSPRCRRHKRGRVRRQLAMVANRRDQDRQTTWGHLPVLAPNCCVKLRRGNDASRPADSVSL